LGGWFAFWPVGLDLDGVPVLFLFGLGGAVVIHGGLAELGLDVPAVQVSGKK